ncbi:MAG: Ni/Fe-hydrogenase cytochrome b subunit [Acidobacteriota bacterium]|nr:Ni/Fe-hydrogenase cytochrome b subunit [Acidobacteriota bacterium]
MSTAAAVPVKRFRPGFWTIFFGLISIPFCIVTVLRFYKGLGAVTHLSDKFPWGLWIGFDLLCGVGLAAGAFTLTAVVHLFNIRKFEPIVRPTILTGFLGYIFVIMALMYDLGQPWRIWHAIIYWNPHSVMFEVAWCVMLYTTVLAVEFAPMVLERFGYHTPVRIIHGLITPLVIAGVLLSTLHQSSLGSLYLIVPSKLHPLWYSQLLPLFFFISAIGAGIGMVILESYMSQRAFGRQLEMDLLEPLARAMVVCLGIYGLLRLQAIGRNGAFGAIADFTYEGRMFLVEFVLGVLVPVVMLSFRRVRTNPGWLVVGSFLAVLGFIVNRLNVSITGMEGAAGVRYVPSLPEIVVSVGLVGIGMAAFALAVRYLQIFPEQPSLAEGGSEGS